MSKRLAVLSLALAALAAPAHAVHWKQVKRDNQAMLSIDTESIKRSGDEVSLNYLVDFRFPQGEPQSGPVYRSIVVRTKVRCKARTISVQHTDAYAQFGAAGLIVAKTKATPAEMAFRPLEPESSDLEVYQQACNDFSAPAPAPAPPVPPKAEPKKK